jgi:hypothetical protein
MSTSTAVRRPGAAILAAMAVAALAVGVFAASASAAVVHFDGKVLSKDSSARTFQVKTQNGATRTVAVNGATKFERITGGFSGLDAGLRVGIDAKKTGDGLLAKQVEKDRNGGGGNDAGGHHGGGNDDGPNHT